MRRWIFAITAVVLAAGVCAEAGNLANTEGLQICPIKDGLYVVEQIAHKGEPAVQITYHHDTSHVALNPLTGRVKSAAGFKDSLYLVFDNGTVVRDAGPYPQLVLRSLPGSAKAERVFADADHEHLFVAGRRLKEDSPAATTAPATSKSVEKTEESWTVYESVAGEWRLVCDLPLELGENSDLVFTAENDRIDVFSRNGAKEVRHWRFADGKWIQLPPVALKTDSIRIWAIEIKGASALIISSAAKAGEELWLYPLGTDDAAINPTVLQIDGKNAAFKTSYGVADDGKNILAAYRAKDQTKINLLRWSGDGKYLGTTGVEGQTVLPGESQDHSTLLTIIMIVVLMVVMFSRRFAGPEVIQEPPAGWVYSAYWRRAAAFIVDLLLVSIAFALILGFLQPQELLAAMERQKMLQVVDTSQIDPRLIRYGLLNLGIFALYCTLMEVKWGWTIGKWFFRLQVWQAGNMTERATWWQIAMRNVAKILEMQMLPLLIMMVLTRNRQRIGDMLSRTVVLQRKPETDDLLREKPADRE